MADQLRAPSHRRVVLVTGASSGIGAATCRLFAQAGWDVVGLARRKDVLGELFEGIRAAAPPVSLMDVVGDVNRDEDVHRALRAVRERFQRLDALVNNAGIGVFGRVEDTPIDLFRLNMETNYLGAVRCTQAALPLLRETSRGNPGRWGAAIVMISSTAGKRSFPGLTSYCATKFALEALSEGLRCELERDRISVSVVNPGTTKTEFVEVALGDHRSFPSGGAHGMPPERVAEAILAAVHRPARNLYVSFRSRVRALLERFSPGLVDFIAGRM
jgi:hypothetical protein